MRTPSKRVSKVTNKKAVATPVKNPYVFDPATDKVEWRKPTPLDVTERRINQYFGETDPAQYIHSHKTHRTASEAFRDADYATPIWRCENDWDRTVEILKWVGVWVATLSFLYSFMVGFEKWMSA